MKITQIGRVHNLIGTATNATALGGITIASNSTLPIQQGYVWTAQSSNTAAWVANVNTITANSSNAVLSPIVNFTGAGGVAITASSNTITVTGSDTSDNFLTVDGGEGHVLVDLGASGVAATVDWSLANRFDLTLTSNTTITMANVPGSSGEGFEIGVTLRQDAIGGHTVTWDPSITWFDPVTGLGGGAAPVIPSAASAQTYVTLSVTDGSTIGGSYEHGALAHSSNSLVGVVTISHDASLAMTIPTANTLHMSAPYVNQVVTNGEDTLVWHGDDLVHELVRIY